jgi:hypothetical protein
VGCAGRGERVGHGPGGDGAVAFGGVEAEAAEAGEVDTSREQERQRETHGEVMEVAACQDCGPGVLVGVAAVSDAFLSSVVPLSLSSGRVTVGRLLS